MQAELQVQITEKKHQLVETQMRIETAETALTAEAEVMQDWKQLRADSNTSLLIHSSLKLTMNTLYEKKNMKKYDMFKLQLQNHFCKYHIYFTTDDLKIVKTVDCLSDNVLLKWSQYTESLENSSEWNQLENFLLWQINDPKLLIQQAQQKIINTKQWLHQSIWEFTAYLTLQEALLPEQYSERQQKKNLWT